VLYYYNTDMTTIFRPRTLVLFVGDLLFFALSLWVSLALRSLDWPTRALLVQHLVPFSMLFVAWVVVYFIAGLYESRSIILARRALSATLLVAQTFNLLITALFFFVVPAFGIAPKALLLIYLPVSFLLVLLWRAWAFPRLGIQKQEAAVLVGSSPQCGELAEALNAAPRAPTRIVATVVPGGDVSAQMEHILAQTHARIVIADFTDKAVAGAFPELIKLLGEGVRFFDANALYEEVFGRIALNAIDDSWIARNVSRYAHVLYDSLKRVMDVVVALPAAIISLIFYPFVIVAIKLDDGGPIFITQERVGEGNKIVHLRKFRSMERNDVNLASAEHKTNKVTRVGKFLRVSRLDELPQLWSVVTGQLSLIGPRPELPSGVALYEKEIPYYASRHLIKPGLSGWAQLYHDNHPHHGTNVEATREKFSYDLYYLKHRSLVVDATIVLKTIKKLLTRSGV